MTAVVDDKQNIKMSTTNYIFRNKVLETITQYDFVESFEVIPKSRFPKGQQQKIIKTMLDNDGIYDNGRYVMFNKESKNYMTHIIRPLSKKLTSNYFLYTPCGYTPSKFSSQPTLWKNLQKTKKISGSFS